MWANPPHTAFGIAIATGSVDAEGLIGGNSGRVLDGQNAFEFAPGGCCLYHAAPR